MNKFIEVVAIVEGKTEQTFIESVLAPYLATKMIFMTATQVSKAGTKGGDIRFNRVKKDLEVHLKQRSDTFVTTFVDYYGVKEWPGVDQIPLNAVPAKISEIINKAMSDEIMPLFAAQQAERRFIPYIAVHEFEALLFSDSSILATSLGIDKKVIDEVLRIYGDPEAINDSPVTAPSKRLDKWSLKGRFPKTTGGIAIAREIGIARMREKCKQFNLWLERLETIVGEKA